MTKFLFVMFFICSGFSAFAQQETAPSYPLKGVFKNQDSAVITGLRLDFTKNGQTNSVYTDINGEFETKLSPGLYQLTVNKIVSERFIAFVNIQENGLNPSFIEFSVETSLCGEASDDSCPKIMKSVMPLYPPAARAVRAWGEVVVEVKIDKEGNVVKASALNGHPLLRAASERAARNTRFEASENTAERQMKLTFVFLPPQPEEKKGINRYSNPYRIETTIPDAYPVDQTNTK